jgi:hypothetical protein
MLRDAESASDWCRVEKRMCRVAMVGRRVACSWALALGSGSRDSGVRAAPRDPTAADADRRVSPGEVCRRSQREAAELGTSDRVSTQPPSRASCTTAFSSTRRKSISPPARRARRAFGFKPTHRQQAGRPDRGEAQCELDEPLEYEENIADTLAAAHSHKRECTHAFHPPASTRAAKQPNEAG